MGLLTRLALHPAVPGWVRWKGVPFMQTFRVTRRAFLRTAATTAGAIAALPLLGTTAAHASPQPRAPLVSSRQFSGVTVLVGGPTGPAVTSPVEKFRHEWEERTGAKVELVTFAFADLYDKIRSSIAAGKPFADIYLFSAAWAGDVYATKTLLPVPDDIKARLNMDDLTPNFKNKLLLWQGVQYAFPYDGDSHMYYYRKDLLENPQYQKDFKDAYGYDLAPAKTWEQYTDIAEFFTKVDWNQGGEHYGTIESMGRKKWSFYTFFDQAAGLAKHPEDPNFFFDDDTMKPRINTPPFVEALENWAKRIPFGPPGMVSMGYDEDRIFFPGGQAAQTYEWHDVGTLTYDEKRSTVRGKDGSAICPGATKVYNQKTKNWEQVPTVNFAPGQWFGGWVIGVVDVPGRAQNVTDAAMDFAVFMSTEKSMEEVVLPDSGINPSRYSHFNNLKVWVDAGYPEENAKLYLEAIKQTYEHPNAIQDMRIPGVFEYYDVLEQHTNEFLSGQVSAQKALDDAAREWEAITDRIGRDQQRAIYKADLNIP